MRAPLNSVMRTSFFLIAVFLFSAISRAQVTITPAQTAAALAQKLVGTGVVVLNPTMTCPNNANGIFVVTSSNLGLDSGIILTSGQAAAMPGILGANSPAPDPTASTDNLAGGDADLDGLVINGQSTNDACTLEFDFIPAGDTIKFDYVFGSEEYGEYTCTQFNDVFGFFISGGTEYPVRKNIALVPGTGIPVAVNTVNNGPTGSGQLINCQLMGPGSPFSAYYVDNLTGTTIVYDGLTTVLQAVAGVTPCDTYHLKLGVADVSDWSLDSGVFLKAGSLNSNASSVSSVGGGGLSAPVPYCVRGCLPGKFVFSRPQPKPTPMVVRYQIGGTAANGVDYTAIPDSVVIPANATSVTEDVQALLVGGPTGPKTVTLFIYSPYNCSNGTPLIIDSATLTIYDSLYVHINTNDTAICLYQSVPISVNIDPIMTYTWSPAIGLDNPTLADPTATPLTTTTYTVTASLPQSGCPIATDQITITILQAPQVNVGPDTTICLGQHIDFNTSVSPANQTYSFSWNPETYLNNGNLQDPVSTPTADITYVITASPGASGCSGYDSIHIHVLPNEIAFANHDTAICIGASIPVNAVGDNEFTYSWTPTTGVSNPAIPNPTITPDTSTLYLLTASYPGCPDITHSIAVDVQPIPTVIVGADRAGCQWDTVDITPIITPAWYSQYNYSWTPVSVFYYANVPSVVFRGDTTSEVVLTVTTPAGCKGVDSALITVHPGNFASFIAGADTAICPGEQADIIATGGVSYHWTPNIFMNDSGVANPVLTPVATGYYTGYVTDQYGCRDTLLAHIVVHPGAVIDLPDSVTIFPGESYQISPQTNCVNFQWFPPLGLSALNISDPIASPLVNTRYTVHASTEYGCQTVDSIDVFADPTELLTLPNAFAPGNGPNNQLKIIKRGIATLKYFRIFNRWGVQVFETSNIDEGWDGKYKGTPQPTGVYVYMVEAESITGLKFEKQGNVTLIR